MRTVVHMTASDTDRTNAKCGAIRPEKLAGWSGITCAKCWKEWKRANEQRAHNWSALGVQ